jgi:hypothetical protein
MYLLSYQVEPFVKLFQNFAYRKLSQGSDAQVNVHALKNKMKCQDHKAV